MHGKFRIGSYDTSVPAQFFGKTDKNRGNPKDMVHLAFDTISSNARIKLEQVSPPVFDIRIRLKARILEKATFHFHVNATIIRNGVMD